MNVKELRKTVVEIAQKRNVEALVENIKHKSEEIPLNIAFLGEVKSGKSTIVNALIKRDLLPMRDTPTTGVITEVLAGDEEGFEAITFGEEGKETATQISLADLSEYIIGNKKCDRIYITLKPVGVLMDNFRIVDTPGVHSLKEIHDDITFGYLPFVDVAFIVMDITYGSATESLLKFLQEKVSKNYLSKIYFIITKKDDKPPDAWNNIKDAFQDSLKGVAPIDKILLLSGKLALEGILENNADKIKDSDIESLEKIIIQDVFRTKKNLQNKKLMRKIKKSCALLADNLRKAQEALSWDTPQIGTKIEELSRKIQDLEIKKAKRFEKFNNGKRDTTQKIINLVDELAPEIARKQYKGERYSDIVVTLTNEVIETTSQHLNQVIGEINKGFEAKKPLIVSIIESSVGKIESIKSVTEMVSFLTTTAILLGISAGTGAAGSAAKNISTAEKLFTGGFVGGKVTGKTTKRISKAAAEAAKQGVKQGATKAANQFLMKGLVILGDTLEKINPIDQIGKLIGMKISAEKLKTILKASMMRSVNDLFDSVRVNIDDYINREFEVPIREERRTMEDLKAKKREKKLEKDKEYENIQNDIELLKKVQETVYA